MPTDDARLLLGDCLEKMAEIPDASVDLILTDPPYHRVKSDGWDRQWKTAADYLDWVGRICVEWQRVLKPNGSLYCFASPRMAARVECKIGETFDIINAITWRKDFPCGALKYGAENFRGFVEMSERIIFAEHLGADFAAKGEIGGHFFQPIQQWMDSCRWRKSTRSIAAESGLPESQVSHYFRRDANGWRLPDQGAIDRLRRAIPIAKDADELRAWYEELRREYEGRRRTFGVSQDVPYTDVWDYPPVPQRSLKHPCEKPLAILKHIISASSRPGDVVLDSCMGSGTTGMACGDLGRKFIGIERDPAIFCTARHRVAAHQSSMPLLAGVS